MVCKKDFAYHPTATITSFSSRLMAYSWVGHLHFEAVASLPLLMTFSFGLIS